MAGAPKYLAAVPSLDELSRDPNRVAATLPVEAAMALLLKTIAMQNALSIRVAAAMLSPHNQPAQGDAADDRMLTVEEAAEILRRERRWIYRNAAQLPFVKRISPRSLLISENGLRRWLERQKM
jgi:hypothetical protein